MKTIDYVLLFELITMGVAIGLAFFLAINTKKTNSLLDNILNELRDREKKDNR